VQALFQWNDLKPRTTCGGTAPPQSSSSTFTVNYPGIATETLCVLLWYRQPSQTGPRCDLLVPKKATLQPLTPLLQTSSRRWWSLMSTPSWPIRNARSSSESVILQCCNCQAAKALFPFSDHARSNEEKERGQQCPRTHHSGWMLSGCLRGCREARESCSCYKTRWSPLKSLRRSVDELGEKRFPALFRHVHRPTKVHPL